MGESARGRTIVSWVVRLLAAGIAGGAIASHLTVLGVEVQGDGGLLFALALTVLAAALVARSGSTARGSACPAGAPEPGAGVELSSSR